MERYEAKTYTISKNGKEQLLYCIVDTLTNKIIFKVHLEDELFKGEPQIHLENEYDIYDGPVNLLWKI